jgi:hypothetical protein
MTPIPCNEGIMLTTSQLVFAFILLRLFFMCQYKFYSLWFDQIVDRNHDLPHMHDASTRTISPQERYCLL